MMSQNTWVYRQLKKGRGLTAKQARNEHGIERLSARIHNLKDEGWDIDTHMVRVENRYGQICHVARYWMALPA